MTKLRRLFHWPSVRALPPLSVAIGLATAMSGLYLLVGLAVTLVVGGVVLVAGGLLVDV